MTPELLVTLLLFMTSDSGRRGYKHLLDDFWDEARRSGIELPCEDPVSAAAFCKARRKLKPALMTSLLTRVCNAITDRHEESLLWQGRRVFAIDGMRHNLQRGDDLADVFGTPHGGLCPQMLVSTLYDVIGKFPCAATIAPQGSCERQELLKLIAHLGKGDVLVLDRGYPSFEVLQALTDAGIDFVIRVPKSGTFGAIQAFQERDGADSRVLIQPSPAEARAGVKSLEVRAVRIDVGADEPWILLTSLRRCEIIRSLIGEIYHLRWEVEEFYKLLKSDYFTQRQFHAKSADGVEQELRAQLLCTAIARLLMANAVVESDTPHQRLSPKSGILAVANGIIRLLLCDDPDRQPDHHASLLRRLAKHVVKRRPGRSYPRRSFKPGPRWNSKGRARS